MKKLFLYLGVILALFLPVDSHAAKGLKKTVAVFEFSNDSGYNSIANLGDDFSMQLSDALIQSGKFIVLTRKDLDVVMAEQDLAASGRMAKSKTARIGKIIPAQILIKGKITEFEENTSGGGQGLTIKGISIGANKASAHIAVIVQLVDSTTGEILDSKRVEGDAKAGGFSIGYSGSFSINSSSFKKTPLGKAVQMAIDRAVVYIARKLSSLPWRGRVVLVKDGLVYVNAGRNAGLQPGDRLYVYKEGEALVDPDTGMELGKETKQIASIKITEVQDKFSKANIEQGDINTISKGDLILEK